MNKQPMTEAEIIEGNTLIAHFMEMELEVIEGHSVTYEWVPMQPHGNWCFKDPPPFNKNWQWLMPVVEKIETLNAHFTIGANKYCDINVEAGEYEDEWDYFYFPFFVSTDADPVINKYKTLIEAVWLCVIEFIKWYNKNSKA